MKLKKSFSASILIIIVSIFFSCKSIDNSNIQNIYIEYLNIGDTYFKLEDYQNASKYYNLALSNKDIYWATYYKLANCYAFMSDWNNALSMYKKILKRDEQNSTIKANIAYIYAMKGDFHYAEIIYESLISEQENNKDYIENYLAIILEDKKNFDDNKEKFNTLFEKLQENYPDSNNISILKNKYDELTAVPEDNSEEDTETQNNNSEITKDEDNSTETSDEEITLEELLFEDDDVSIDEQDKDSED